MLQIATALCDWASPAYRKNARHDTELPDDPQEMMETFDRSFLFYVLLMFLLRADRSTRIEDGMKIAHLTLDWTHLAGKISFQFT